MAAIRFRQSSCLVVCLLALIGCRSPAEPGARNLLLVTIDTLRADHLGCYGYHRPTSPHLDDLAGRATRFERALSSSPWTLPSHASLFTGLEPSAHGAISFLHDLRPFNAYPLEEGHLTLTEALGRAGFNTAAFVANVIYLGKRTGLQQGFDSYEVHRERAARQNTRILEWLEANAEEPFFLFVNYMDSHRPYNSAAGRAVVDPPAETDDSLLDQLIQAVMSQSGADVEDLIRRVVAQYDTGISHADAALGELLDKLRSLDLEHETLIVVTSDHGEYFGEHQLVEHSKDVYQEALWVPLIIREAGQEDGRVESRVVTSSDVPHLIVSGLSPRVRESLSGRFPARGDSELAVAENYYSRAKDLRNPVWGHRFRRIRRAIYDWPLKYIESSDGAHELYDLEEDPTESRNLIERRVEDAARLQAALARRAIRSGTQASPPETDLTPEERAALRELGYAE